MVQDIEKRIKGINHIMMSVYYNNEVMEYLALKLRNESINLKNNLFLSWINKKLIENQIINFYKLFKKPKKGRIFEKFSFHEFLRIIKYRNYEINYNLLDHKVNVLYEEYESSQYQTIREKYIAHLDLNVPIIRLHIIFFIAFSKNILKLFDEICKEFNIKPDYISENIKDSLNQIFNQVSISEKIKRLCFDEKLKGNEILELSKINDIIN
ncbi:MAG: hypothetical protein RAP70_05870 [Candidatus Celaenobacter antarcticus]|nr:hypothetical protein [Candidatus Celaenobacter antarcticus]MDP8314586.1 hypothetical protein [Candidatus Celaenobacter antarcticus]